MKFTKLSLATIVAMGLGSSAFAASDLAGAFKEGKVSGTVKAIYFDTALQETDSASNTTDAQTFVVGGKLKYTTAPLYGFTAGVEFLTTQDLGTKSQKNTGGILGAGENDSTLLMANTNDADGLSKSNYGSGSALGSAYISYAFGKDDITVGRFELPTPLAASKETRMLPTVFQGAVAHVKDIPNTVLAAAFVNGVKERDSDKFVKMGQAALNNLGQLGLTGAGIAATPPAPVDAGALNDAKNSQVYAAAAIYLGIPGVVLQAWDYYATNILNAVYVQADYKTKLGAVDFSAAAQYLRESDVGNFKKIWSGTVNGIDAQLYGAKVAAGIAGFTGTLAYSQVSDGKADKLGGIIAPWDGTPAFTDGANNNNLGGAVLVDGTASIYGGSYAAGSKNWKAQVDYDFANIGVKGLSASVSYAMYDRKWDTAKLGMKGFDVNEWNIMAKYSFDGALKGLGVQGLIIPMDIKENDASQITNAAQKATASDRTQYRAYVTYSF